VLLHVRRVRRGSYFFAIDAFVATIIIVATLLILYGKHEYTPSATQAFTAADGYLSYIIFGKNKKRAVMIEEEMKKLLIM